MKNLILILAISICNYSLAQSKKYSPVRPWGDQIIEFKEKLLIADIYTYKPQVGFENLDSISRREFLSEEVHLLFDQNGNLIESLKTSHDPGFRGHRKVLYRYNDKNNLVEQVYQYRSDKHKVVYEYSEESENFNEIKYDYKEFQKKYDVKYDSYTINEIKDGLLLGRKESTSYGSIKREVYKYNSKGDVVYESRYGVITETKYKYDQRGNIVEEYIINNYNKGGYRSYKYNSEDKVIEKVFYELNKTPASRVRRKYENNFLVQEIFESYKAGKYKKHSQTDYIIDEKGNWIEKRVTKDGFPYQFVFREFTYSNRVKFEKIPTKQFPVILTSVSLESKK